MRGFSGRNSWSAVLLAFAWLLMGTTEGLAAHSCGGARVVTSAGRGFLAAARSGSPAAFSRVLSHHVNMRSIAFFALGRYRRKLPRRTYGRFIALSRRYVSRKLAAYAGQFRGGAMEVSRCRGNVVETRLSPSGQRVLWRLRAGRIADVRIAGVWLALALRRHFAGLIRQAGGDMQIFMARLK